MSGSPKHNDSIDAIIKTAAAEEGAADKSLSQDDLKAMADTLDLLIADFGTWKGYKAASSEYIEEFSKEIKWHRGVRTCVTLAGALIVIFLAVLLMYGVLHAKTIFGPDPSHSLTALIAGCITGCVIVTIAMVKGAFSNLADRNAGLPMPEHIKEIVEAAKAFMPGS